jgi:hypothetical protein
MPVIVEFTSHQEQPVVEATKTAPQDMATLFGCLGSGAQTSTGPTGSTFDESIPISSCPVGTLAYTPFAEVKLGGGHAGDGDGDIGLRTRLR